MRDYAILYSLLLQDLGLTEPVDPNRDSDMGIDMAFRTALASSFYKKLAPDGNTAAADDAALIKFKRINDKLPTTQFGFEANSEVESLFWDYFRTKFNTCLDPSEEIENFDLDFIREHMMCGPGSAQKADSRTLVTKLFESQMTYTEEHLIRLYRGALVETGLWADAEKRRFERFGFTRVSGGKLFFAPKNSDISRTCCTEANLNMLIQQAIGAFYEYRLAHFFGIRLDSEPDFNRELARIGSMTGSFGTIDLVSASDSIGLQLMRTVQRPGFLSGVTMLSRSERAVLPDGSEVVLNMISTMGNGFTFPLQTLMFACVVHSVYTLMGIPLRDPDSGRRTFGVFGDDIVVHRDAYEFTIRMLSKLGFEVNVGKSFNGGLFRESCGHDYYAGVNIRGVYVRTLEAPQNVYSLINRLHRWSSHSGIRLHRTLKLLLSWVRDLRVPPSEGDDAGVHVPSYLMTNPIVSDRYWYQYRSYKRRNRRMQVLEADEEKIPFNEEGLGVGFLSGVYRRPEFSRTQTDVSQWHNRHTWAVSATLRDTIGSRARYKIVNKEIPWWDFLLDPKMGEEITSGTRFALDENLEQTWRIPLTRNSYDAWSSVVAATYQTDM